MAKTRSGMVFERVAWYLTMEYLDRSGKLQKIQKKTRTKKSAEEMSVRIESNLRTRLGDSIKLTQTLTCKSIAWYARLTFTDEAGNRRYIKRRAESKTEAKELLKEIIRDLDDNGDSVVEGSKITVAQFFAKWLETAVRSRVSERTYSDYEDLIRRYLQQLGRKTLSDVRLLDIQSLYMRMEKQGLSPRTIRYTHAVLNSAFKQAVIWGLISRNPAQLAKAPKQIRQEMKALTPEMAGRFLRTAATDKWGVLFRLALVTGMRPEEYLGLKWQDINFQRGIVTVQRTLCWRRRGGGYYFGEPKTSQSRRSIPIPTSLSHALIEHKRKQEQERRGADDYEMLDLVFATPLGGPLMLQNLMRRHFKPILKRANLPESIRLYDLRHSCATLLLAADENPKVVSERLGHASVTSLLIPTHMCYLPCSVQRRKNLIACSRNPKMLRRHRKRSEQYSKLSCTWSL